MLLERGADARHKNQWGRMPLHVAAYVGRADVARVLIAHGADLDDIGYFGPPIFEASQTNNLDVCRVLVESGCDVNKINKDGDTALDVARGNKITEYLTEHGAVNGRELRKRLKTTE